MTPLIWTTGFQNDNEGERERKKEFTFEMSQSIILATLHLTICSRVQVITGGKKTEMTNKKPQICIMLVIIDQFLGEKKGVFETSESSPFPVKQS